MKLVLIRHGDAGAYTLPDAARNLSALGQAQAAQTADFLKTHMPSPDMLIVSPYARARQTLAVLCEALNWQQTPVIYEGVTPDDDARAAIAGLSALIETAGLGDDAWVVVVCHMGIIAELAALLSGDTKEDFALAEARIYDLPCVAVGANAEQIGHYVPMVRA